MVPVFQYFELINVIVYCESGNSEGCCHGDSPIKSGRFAAGSCRPAFFCKPSFTVFIVHLIIFYTSSVLYVQMHLAKLRLLYSIFLYISFLQFWTLVVLLLNIWMMRVHERSDLLLFQSFKWQVSSLKVITKNMGWCVGMQQQLWKVKIFSSPLR